MLGQWQPIDTANSNVNPLAGKEAMTTCTHYEEGQDMRGTPAHSCTWLYTGEVVMPQWFTGKHKVFQAHPSSCAGCPRYDAKIIIEAL
jgi:hypothetical protein